MSLAGGKGAFVSSGYTTFTATPDFGESKPSRASANGETWRDPPAIIPEGKTTISDNGTLISTAPQRFNILRSADAGKTSQEVFTFTPEIENLHGAEGLRDAAFGYVSGK